MVPSLDGEFARKRRMMSHAWPIVLRGGMLAPRGYGLRYGWMILSHRVLRYGAPALHLVALVTCALLVGRRAPSHAATSGRPGRAARRRPRGAGGSPLGPLLAARYYVLMNTAMAAGLWDHVRRGTPVGWVSPEGTR